MPGEGAVWPAMVRKGWSIVERGEAQVDHAADLEDDDARAARARPPRGRSPGRSR